MIANWIFCYLDKCKLLTTPLQRMGAGFFLGGLSFTISGILELQLEVDFCLNDDFYI